MCVTSYEHETLKFLNGADFVHEKAESSFLKAKSNNLK